MIHLIYLYIIANIYGACVCFKTHAENDSKSTYIFVMLIAAFLFLPMYAVTAFYEWLDDKLAVKMCIKYLRGGLDDLTDEQIADARAWRFDVKRRQVKARLAFCNDFDYYESLPLKIVIQYKISTLILKRNNKHTI